MGDSSLLIITPLLQRGLYFTLYPIQVSKRTCAEFHSHSEPQYLTLILPYLLGTMGSASVVRSPPVIREELGLWAVKCNKFYTTDHR